MASPARALGPRTPEGKRKVSQNARKHGFRAITPIYTPAQKTEIQKIEKQFTQDFQSQSAEQQEVLTAISKSL